MCCCSGIASFTDAFVIKLQIAFLAQPSLASAWFVTAKYCQTYTDCTACIVLFLCGFSEYERCKDKNFNLKIAPCNLGIDALIFLWQTFLTIHCTTEHFLEMAPQGFKRGQAPLLTTGYWATRASGSSATQPTLNVSVTSKSLKRSLTEIRFYCPCFMKSIHPVHDWAYQLAQLKVNSFNVSTVSMAFHSFFCHRCWHCLAKICCNKVTFCSTSCLRYKLVVWFESAACQLYMPVKVTMLLNWEVQKAAWQLYRPLSRLQIHAQARLRERKLLQQIQHKQYFKLGYLVSKFEPNFSLQLTLILP